MTVSISRVPIHTLESAPDASRDVLAELAQRSPTPGQPINLHAQMAHAPAVLLGYMALRRALDEHGTLDRKVRTAILLSVAAADGCAYTVALNTLIAGQSGWTPADVDAIRTGSSKEPEHAHLAALLGVAREAALNGGRVEEVTWGAARTSGWTESDLLEAFALVGLTQYVDSFVNFARTDLDSFLLRDAAPTQVDIRLTHLLIVEDQDRTRAFYEQVLGATVIRERDPVILQFHNSSIVANIGGPPTDDKPDITLAPPLQPNIAYSALNVRVSDIQSVYERWRARGGHFLTPPIQHDGEIRCYLRDPDGHLIEVGQLTA
jgi:catechol 2,3-dioxygenase-like lactoylglutathione lyase family enzyme